MPLMSQRAMSMPLSRVVTNPPNPPPPVNRRYSLCQMRSMYCGSSPMRDSRKSSPTVELRRKRAILPTMMLPPPPELVASPMPDTPSSVSILKKTNERPRGSGLVTQTFKSVIFIVSSCIVPTYGRETRASSCVNTLNTNQDSLKPCSNSMSYCPD